MWQGQSGGLWALLAVLAGWGFPSEQMKHRFLSPLHLSSWYPRHAPNDLPGRRENGRPGPLRGPGGHRLIVAPSFSGGD